uniref:hypothetical protein n=1 Tax=Klebsiella pneumoniae TaxID=573 RepID=UPI0013D3CEFF
MLRSLQHLRETEPAAALIASDEERLLLAGGGSGYRMPWHWRDGLMILLPAVGAVDFRDETRPSGAWLGQD